MNEQDNPEYHKLQVQLDAKIQEIVDLKAGHDARISAIVEGEQAHVKRLTEAHAAAVQDADQKLAALKAECEAIVADVRARAEFRVSQEMLTRQAAVEKVNELLTVLNEPPQARLLRAEHARDAAAFAAKQEADRKALAAKLGK